MHTADDSRYLIKKSCLSRLSGMQEDGTFGHLKLLQRTWIKTHPGDETFLERLLFSFLSESLTYIEHINVISLADQPFPVRAHYSTLNARHLF